MFRHGTDDKQGNNRHGQGRHPDPVPDRRAEIAPNQRDQQRNKEDQKHAASKCHIHQLRQDFASIETSAGLILVDLHLDASIGMTGMKTVGDGTDEDPEHQ